MRSGCTDWCVMHAAGVRSGTAAAMHYRCNSNQHSVPSVYKPRCTYTCVLTLLPCYTTVVAALLSALLLLLLLHSGGFTTQWEADEPRQSKFIFIGKNLDKDELTSKFMACVAAKTLRFKEGDAIQARRSKVLLVLLVICKYTVNALSALTVSQAAVGRSVHCVTASHCSEIMSSQSEH
jgi:Cobalamin synthesis protein cobW C-terminal domain